MPTEPEPRTVAEAVRYAVAACDPTGTDPDLGRFLEHFEDADEPIRNAPDLELRLAEAAESIEPDDTLPALLVASAIVTYLAFRPGEVTRDRHTLLSLAARAEFHDAPPEHVAEWLRAEGADL